MLRRLFLLALLWPVSAVPQTAPADPMTLRARDAHQNLTILADPYLSSERYDKDHFGKRSPFDAGIVAINVYFRNDNDTPIRFNPNTIQLIVSTQGGVRERLDPLPYNDVADRTVLGSPSEPTARPRFPVSSNPGKNKAWRDLALAIQGIALSTDIVPPHATTHGFLFYDMNHRFDAIRRSHLYVPDLIFMTDKKALLFFEIDLSVVPMN